MLYMVVTVAIALVSVSLAQEATAKMTDGVVTKPDVVLLKNVIHIRSEAY
jgi:hypothetical protein